MTTELDIKLLAAQRMSDTDDGGGRKTGLEIVDGNINNMFKDISRLDRTYGRVSLMKCFPSVTTDDNDMYSGMHIIVSNPTKDQLVSVCIFTTPDPTDTRTEAKDRVESYVTQGPRYGGWLWGNQLEGQRQIRVFQSVGSEIPGVGDVLFLIKDEGTAAEKSQYVRVTKVQSSEESFNRDYGSTVASFNRQIVDIEIGDPLRYTFPGIEITDVDTTATNLYSTVVADAAQYFGVMNLKTVAAKNDIVLNVNSIFTHLVPSAQSESPLIDLSIGEAGPVMGSGEPMTVTSNNHDVKNGAVFNFGRGIKPGSLNFTVGGQLYIEDGFGVLSYNSNQVAVVDYGLGQVTFKDTGYSAANVVASAIIGTEINQITNTDSTYVDINNRGYNYTTILEPLPSPGTLIVDYMSQGRWYRLRENSKGELVPDIAGTGTGTLNPATGHTMVTTGALPDVNTNIIYSWGNPLEVESIAEDVTIAIPEVVHQVLTPPIKPGSVVITWPTGEGVAQVTDDGSGSLTGDGSGSVDYADGLILLRPTAVPASGSEYTFDYEKYPRVIENLAASGGAGVEVVQLTDAPVKAGTVTLNMEITLGGLSHIYKFTDNGAGTMSAPGVSVNFSVAHPEYSGSTSLSGCSATIDYNLGRIVVNTGDISGTETWEVPEVKTSGGGYTAL